MHVMSIETYTKIPVAERTIKRYAGQNVLLHFLSVSSSATFDNYLSSGASYILENVKHYIGNYGKCKGHVWECLAIDRFELD